MADGCEQCKEKCETARKLEAALDKARREALFFREHADVRERSLVIITKLLGIAPPPQDEVDRG